MDWQVGDLALCVRGGCIDGRSVNYAWPESGRLYSVILPRVFFDGDVYLYLDGAPDNIDEDGTNWGPLWSAERFIKITPEAEDAFDREVIDLMVGKPVKVTP